MSVISIIFIVLAVVYVGMSVFEAIQKKRKEKKQSTAQTDEIKKGDIKNDGSIN